MKSSKNIMIELLMTKVLKSTIYKPYIIHTCAFAKIENIIISFTFIISYSSHVAVYRLRSTSSKGFRIEMLTTNHASSVETAIFSRGS